MALISLRQLMEDACLHGYAIPAFNVNNMEQMLAIMQAADAVDSPVIMQASRGARAFANDVVLSHLIKAAIELYPHIPVCMHQDHGNSPATCLSAITNGFSSVMMDGSLTEDGARPTSFEENVTVTAEVAHMAHMVGVSVEGEIGHLGSLETGRGEAEDGHGYEGELSRDMLLTDPGEAAEFVARTNVDTDLRLAMTGAIRKVLSTSPAEFDPRKYLAPALAAMRDVCSARVKAFGSAERASRITPISLAKMAKRY